MHEDDRDFIVPDVIEMPPSKCCERVAMILILVAIGVAITALLLLAD
jgi:hypothetical protein